MQSTNQKEQKKRDKLTNIDNLPAKWKEEMPATQESCGSDLHIGRGHLRYLD